MDKPTTTEIQKRIEEIDKIQEKKLKEVEVTERSLLIEKYKNTKCKKADGTESNLWDEAVSFWNSSAGKKAIRNSRS